MRKKLFLYLMFLVVIAVAPVESLYAQAEFVTDDQLALDMGPRWHKPYYSYSYRHYRSLNNYNYYPYRGNRCYYIPINRGHVRGGYQYVCR